MLSVSSASRWPSHCASSACRVAACVSGTSPDSTSVTPSSGSTGTRLLHRVAGAQLRLLAHKFQA